MDKFVQVYSGGELVKGPKGVEFGDLSQEGIWFEAAPTYGELIDAVCKRLGLDPATHSVRVQGRTNVGGGAHRHFIMVPINDDMSWSNYVKAVFNGTDWNCLEVYVQAEKRSSAEAVSSEVELMDSEPPDVQRQDAPPPDPAQGASLFNPSMMNAYAPAVHSLRARLRKPRTNTRTYAAKGGAEVQFGQYHTGASEPADTTIYPLIGLYDEDHRARALVSGKVDKLQTMSFICSQFWYNNKHLICVSMIWHRI
jgi:hypothetical protein